jgi:23S rRNA (uracil1939-C5)-methyltransferase
MTTVKFEKVVGEGMGLGYLDGKVCFAAGPLPGEVAEVEVVKDKPGYAQAQVVRFIETSDRRQAPSEEHYLSCSPWQGVDYDYQLELKRGVLGECFARPDLKLPVAELVPAPAQLGYRNKLEFSVINGPAPALAFHARGSFPGLTPLPRGCALGHADMNAAALALAKRAGELKLEDIQTITIRRSELTGRLLAQMVLERPPKRHWPELMVPDLSGLVVSRAQGRRDHLPIWKTGETWLRDRLGGVELGYPYDGFFQTNVPMFEQILTRIVAAVPDGATLVDLYGGVGTIGLAAAHKCRHVTGVEIAAASVEAALANAGRGGFSNYEAVAVAAGALDPGVLADANCVVVDPPRAGLERRTVEAILKAAPARIIYLSCNPATQARDLLLLAPDYTSGAVTGFDLYPGTLHLESLVILEHK